MIYRQHTYWLVVFLLLIFMVVSAQTTVPGDTFATPRRLLFVTVEDEKGQAVEELGEHNFTLLEDEVPQAIAFFSREPMPLSLGLVIDASGSMREKMPAACEAVSQLVKNLRVSDEAFIAQFKQAPVLLADFTNDRDKLSASLSGVTAGGGSSLLDATLAVSNHIAAKGRHPQKAVVVITDGLEKNSSTKEQTLIRRLQQDGVRIFFVALLEEDTDVGFFGTPPSQKAKQTLTLVAKASGGRVFSAKTRAEVRGNLDHLRLVLQQPYMIGYYTTNERLDGKFRRVTIKVQTADKRKLTVFAPPGYFMPGPEKQTAPPRQ
jgi:Ca-activated chloride channel homolog